MPSYPIPSFGNPADLGLGDVIPPGYGGSTWDSPDTKRNRKLQELGELLGSGRAQAPGMQQFIGEARQNLKTMGPDPRLKGQQSHLDKMDTPTPVKVAADAKVMQQQATTSDQGPRHGETPGQTDPVGPTIPGFSDRGMKFGPATEAPASLDTFKFTEDPWLSSGMRLRSAGFDGAADSQGMLESDAQARAYLDRKYGMEKERIDRDYAARYPDSNKEAVLSATADAQLARARLEAKDPLAIERAKSGFENQGRLALYRGQREIDADNETRRAGAYQAIYEEKAAKLAALKSDPKYKSVSPEEQAKAEAIIEARYQALIDSMDKGSSKKTEKIEG